MKWVLSCGCNVAANCLCNAPRDYVREAIEHYHGQWRGLLEGYGVDLGKPRRGSPCPVCGGRDRFVFDDKDGQGTWHCRGCVPCAGGGLLLLANCMNKSIYEMAKELMGDIPRSSAPLRNWKPVDYEALKLEGYLKAEKKAAWMMNLAELGRHDYLIKKGLPHAGWVLNGELLIPVHFEDRLVNVQRISEDGKKFLYGGRVKGAYKIINGNDHSIAIVEGYATGLTVSILTRLRTYVAFSAGNLAEVVRVIRGHYPDKQVIVFGDNDESETGQKAAKACGADRVALPNEIGDWDDLRGRYGREITLNLMRKSIK